MTVDSIGIDRFLIIGLMRKLLRLVTVGVLISTSAWGRAQQSNDGAAGDTNAFWCPMHPDVRSKTPGRCPVCSMELVVIPPPTLGNYQLHVRQIVREGRNGVRALHIEVRHPRTSERVASFSPLHERLLHLFILSRDLSYFAHVHPERAGDGFDAAVELEPGAYVLIADFAPVGGAPQLVQRAIVTRGFKGSPFTSPDLQSDVSEKIVDGLRVSLEAQTKLLKPSVLRFTVHDVATGAPVRDLEPFLGASGHLLVVNADVTTAIHAHPEGKDTQGSMGPDVVFAPTFGTVGVYKLWVQFQRAGTVITAPFAIDVR